MRASAMEHALRARGYGYEYGGGGSCFLSYYFGVRHVWVTCDGGLGMPEPGCWCIGCYDEADEAEGRDHLSIAYSQEEAPEDVNLASFWAALAEAEALMRACAPAGPHRPMIANDLAGPEEAPALMARFRW